MLHFIHECYTWRMPTARPRHMITESDRLAVAIELAAKLWPEELGERAQLVRHILEIGIQAVEAQANESEKARLDAIARAAGSLPSVWPNSWLEEARSDWPA